MKYLSALVFSLFASAVEAFPSGAGNCAAGNAVGGIHLARTSTVSKDAVDSGFVVTIDGEVLSPTTAYTFRSGVKHVVKVTNLKKPFKGFQFRIGGAGTSALEISRNNLNAQLSSVCLAAGASGVTHLDATPKTEAEAIIAIETADSALTLDLTIVVANAAVLAEHYHTKFNLVASATSPTPPTPSPNSAPTFPIDKTVCAQAGDILISGSTTVLPIAQLWGLGYTRSCGNQVLVSGGGSSVGARRVCADKSKGESQVEIGNMSREWKSSETKVASDGFTFRCLTGDTTIDVVQIAVAIDGLTVVTSISAAGGAACIEKMGGLTTDQLRWIFSSYSTAQLTATGWKSTAIPNSDGNEATHLWSELSTRPECPSTEIKIGGESPDNGTTAYFTETIFTDIAKGETFRNPYFVSNNPDVVARDFLKGCSDCVAFFGYAYFLRNVNTMQPAPIRNSKGVYLAPTAETVNNGEYNPLSRTIYMQVNKAKRAKLEGIFKYGFSPAGDADVDSTGYVQLPATVQATMLKRAKKPSGICFSGDSQVNVLNKGLTKMVDLSIGDMVMVADNKYEPVYSFGHKEAGIEIDFLSISTNGRKSLEVSDDHMVTVEGGRKVPASQIVVGDMLVTGSGELAAVKNIRTVERKGAFAPFTRSGSIVVNDLVVSNYVAFKGSEYLMIAGVETPFSFQWLAHTFNSVHRVAYMMGFKGETYSEVGVSHWVEAGHKGANWLLNQNAFVILCAVLAGIFVFGAVSILEAALMSPVTTAALVAGAVLARPFAVKTTGKKA